MSSSYQAPGRVLKQGENGNAGRVNLQFHSTSQLSNRYSFTVATSCSYRILKQGEDGNAGTANLQFPSTNLLVLGIVSQ